MAALAHCLYCFEVLAASLEKRKPLSLRQVEESWSLYSLIHEKSGEAEEDTGLDDEEMTENDDEEDKEDEEDSDNRELEITPSSLQPPSISRLQVPSPASTSSSSTPSSISASSSRAALADTSKSSSKSSLPTSRSPQPRTTSKEEEHPLFVTWNTVSSRGYKSLRGCIGTFEPLPLEEGLKSYALASALEDTRFDPISLRELPSLSNSITLLMNFTPASNAMDWDLGTHGLRISFTYHGRRHGATYLPDVAVEQGWTKEETLISLMRKAGWSGRSSEWNKIDLRVERYEGKKASLGYREWKGWRTWVGGSKR